MARAEFGLIGLDIGASSIRAAELRSARKTSQPTVKRAAWLELPPGVLHEGELLDPSALTKALRQLWRRGRFKRRTVAFAVPVAGELTRQGDLPCKEPAQLRSALRVHQMDALPMDVDTVELDYHLLERRVHADAKGNVQDENRILVVAARREQTSAIAQAIRAADLVPILADHAPLALIRSVNGGRMPVDSTVHAIVDIGAEQLTVIVHAQGQPLFIRVVSPGGGSMATAAIAAQLGIDAQEAEALKRSIQINAPVPVLVPVAESSVFSAPFDIPAIWDGSDAAVVELANTWASATLTEIRNSLDYYLSAEGSPPISDVALVGRSAHMPGLVERMATQLPYPIEQAQPWMGLPGGERQKLQPMRSELALAIGLATASAP